MSTELPGLDERSGRGVPRGDVHGYRTEVGAGRSGTPREEAGGACSETQSSDTRQ
jgi:hypothetical protein